jgi:hypothetical protein
MKDERIRYRPAERAAFVNHRVRACRLTSGNLCAAEIAQLYITVLEKLTAACATPGPFLYVVSRSGLRRIDLGQDS